MVCIARPRSRCLARYGIRLRHLSTPVMPLMALGLPSRRLASPVRTRCGETARLLLRWPVAGPVTLAVPHGRSTRLALVVSTAWVEVAALLGLWLALARVLGVGCCRPRIRRCGYRPSSRPLVLLTALILIRILLQISDLVAILGRFIAVIVRDL